ncbi:PHP domain-containing protein [Denitrificimonas sp. JX-1]|uniref:PHP domain-containing protein n=1 Tax=Denitrificimonas halotolerans TaxID=3098930 RepID=A0ABU5GPU3_9GAMM|nr:PHP domain-containing protein [Denitrificimonas sp. JX-1]MDY7218963.1 PHP domain-containing protein [Denitrificimonas sp. JX-1]
MDIDLHCHSTASDGVLTPRELVLRAHQQGVKILALTDHDTIEGLPAAQEAANEVGIKLINGIELSCIWGGATIHILGYDFALDDPYIVEATESLHKGRWLRAKEIAKRLAAKGMPNTLAGAQAVQAELGDSSNAPARPHFAQYLVKAGHVRDHSDAFNKWLGAGKIGDVKLHWPSLAETMATLVNAGAVISLAHLYHYKFTRTKRRCLLKDFVDAGGHALEVVNGMQLAEQVGTLSILAREFNLKVTAGSDFHLPQKWSELGRYRAVPEDLPHLFVPAQI